MRPWSPVCPGEEGWSDVPVSPHIEPPAALSYVTTVGPQGTLIVAIAGHDSASALSLIRTTLSVLLWLLLPASTANYSLLQLTTFCPSLPLRWWGDVGCIITTTCLPVCPGKYWSKDRARRWLEQRATRVAGCHISLCHHITGQSGLQFSLLYHKHTQLTVKTGYVSRLYYPDSHNTACCITLSYSTTRNSNQNKIYFWILSLSTKRETLTW